ncbi:MAG: DNA/RNA helicase domain-containing protein, partial [Mucinivorans sp.]
MRQYYHNTITEFICQPFDAIWAQLTAVGCGDLLHTQKQAWAEQITILKEHLTGFNGDIFFEYSIPRMGKRIDAVLLIDGIVFVVEFKVGAKEFTGADINQVWDYALDLKYFHEESHHLPIVSILVATNAKESDVLIFQYDDQIVRPILSNGDNIADIIRRSVSIFPSNQIDNYLWSISRYAPTPTIIEAAQALYKNHSVKDISRSDADNLTDTSDYIFRVIEQAKVEQNKVICFVTGVPGAGKTLVGLNISTQSAGKEGANAVYLSGNGPLVDILVEALTRDKVRQLKEQGEKCTKKEVVQEVKSFIQNVHHFRDACLEGTIIEDGKIVADLDYFRSEKNRDKSYAPIDHIAIFDEAQRAWTKDMTANFMSRKKNRPGFPYSEPEFLISCMDRHNDWALIVCLVGGGQEINTGEAGIREWIASLNNHFKDWHVHISSRLTDKEYAAGETLSLLVDHPNVYTTDELHLAVSLRSFRAEKLSLFVHQLLDTDKIAASETLKELTKYPIVLTRDVEKAKLWLKERARGNERYGIIVSSQAYRLRPLAIDVRVKPDPVHWFLSDREDVRSSYYMEDVVTEFDIQGLELDYTCVVWDGDFRYKPSEWGTYSFVGSKWQNIKKEERKMYLKNAYRVLL